jgi:hypothetical protein
MPEISGVSKKGAWKKQDYILSTFDKFPKKICVTLWGDKVGTLKENDKATISISVESREHNGRWYNEVKALNIVKETSQSEEVVTTNEEDDLPF